MSGNVRLNLNLIRQQAEEIVDREAAQRAQELRNLIVQNLSSGGSGRRYTVLGRVHVASAPGQSPAVDTGRLRQSITVEKIGPGRYRVGTNVVYAFALEFGTRTVAPRPFMRPAAERFARGTP